ncbi:MAG: tRNA threonylcarbamoyladenosine dehydratase [Bacilli bacterium]|nr:tRNA threonylcarbamoyladenosine dehydratase [Bacilli bacterium]
MLDRLEILIGDKTKTLKQKTVLLLGLGGVGGHAFETLLRSGIGTIIVVDNDVIDETNLNRQLLSTNKNIGQYKVDEAKKRQKDINQECKIIKINKFINEENIESLFENKIDFVIDAIDTIKTKKQLIKKCIEKQIKIISVMGTGNKMDPTKLTITDIRKTSYDPIAKEIRKFIKEERINKKIPVVFSDETPIKTDKIGSNAFVPATAGIFAASYVINELIKE